MLLQALVLAALASFAQSVWLYDTIFSVHTAANTVCPPDYFADSNFIACCSVADYLTSGYGPGHSMIPACCNSVLNPCSGAAPVMLDWMLTTDPIEGSSMVSQFLGLIQNADERPAATVVAITPGSETTITPASVAPQQTAATKTASSTKDATAIATSSSGSGSSNVNNNDNSQTINVNSGKNGANSISQEIGIWSMAAGVLLSAFFVVVL